MYEIAARMESHFRFSRREIFQLFMTALVAAFGLLLTPKVLFLFNNPFNFIQEAGIPGYFLNLSIAFILIGSALLIHFSAQKIIALKLGYIAEYNYWMNGFIISTVMCVFFPFFFTGSVWCEVEKKLRMGRYRYGVMHKDLGIISFAGPLASMLLAAIASPVYVKTGNPVIYAFIVANLLIAIYSLIPIPTFEKIRAVKGGTTGLYLLIASRWMYVLLATIVLVYSILVLIAQVFSLMVAFLLGVIVAFFYYKIYEMK
jgi:hypothetical protein